VFAGNACFARSVFGVVMRVREVQIGTFRKFLRNAHDGGSVALTESRVDHQRTVVPTTIPMLGNPPARTRARTRASGCLLRRAVGELGLRNRSCSRMTRKRRIFGQVFQQCHCVSPYHLIIIPANDVVVTRPPIFHKTIEASIQPKWARYCLGLRTNLLSFDSTVLQSCSPRYARK